MWEFATSTRERGGNTWWGIDFSAPTVGQPWINEEEVATFKSLHEDLKSLHDASRLAVDQSDDSSSTTDGDNF